MKIVIGDRRNVRGLGKGMVVFRLFAILKSKILKKRSTIFESLDHEQKYLEDEESGKMAALQISPRIQSLYGFGRQATTL